MAEGYRGNANMLDQLAEGATDGSWKKLVRDRGGIVEPTTYAERSQLSDTYFGIHEARVKTLGDGTAHSTPDYGPTPDWRLT